jgi:hypothetical protein
MAEASETLRVLPAALRAASGTIAGHAAQVASPPAALTASTESSGMAAVAVQAAVGEFGTALSGRLSSVADALATASGAFTTTEDTNRAQLSAIAPGTQ